MSGRDPSPGEYKFGYDGSRDGDRYLSRIVQGQIRSVTTEEGKAQIDTHDVIGAREATVPVLWFSGKGAKTAWGRYMPFGGEFVNVGYRNDDHAVIIGYDATASRIDRGAGWKRLQEFEEAGDIPGLSVFRKLKPGEFDYKSSGDAYIHGSNMGTLFLAGGQAFVKLDKQSYRIESKASEFHFMSEVTEFRIGTVFRKEDATASSETPISSGIYKELLIDINQSTPDGGKSEQSKARIHFGDVLNDSNESEEGPFGSNLRGRISIGDSLNSTEVFSFLVDQDGNIRWHHHETAEDGLVMTMESLYIKTVHNIKIAAKELYRINAEQMKIGGEKADEPLVLGAAFKTAIQDLVQKVFIDNADFFTVGNMGDPSPLNPQVLTTLDEWMENFVNNDKVFSDYIFTNKVYEEDEEEY